MLLSDSFESIAHACFAGISDEMKYLKDESFGQHTLFTPQASAPI
jgi:hypothetical protein